MRTAFTFSLHPTSEHPHMHDFEVAARYNFQSGICTRHTPVSNQSVPHLISITSDDAFVGGIEFETHDTTTDKNSIITEFGEDWFEDALSHHIPVNARWLKLTRFVLCSSYRTFYTAKCILNALYEHLQTQEHEHVVVVMSRVEAFQYINWCRSFGFEPISIHHCHENSNTRHYYTRSPECIIIFSANSHEIRKRFTLVEDDAIFHDTEIKDLLERFADIRNKRVRHQMLLLMKEVIRSQRDKQKRVSAKY